ncbi:MAG: hypothetical protein ACW99U_11085 [Candidatus Thorarchaeota archaeon]|jgi:hypothetical protein
MIAYRVNVFSGMSGGVSETVTLNLGSQKTFYAWCQINTIDSLTDFDRDNAVAIDIYKVDGVRTTWRVSGGDHFGASDTWKNVHEGALVGYGQRITFRIRAMHSSDLSVHGTGIVLVP